MKVSLGLKSKFFKKDSKSSMDVDDDEDAVEAVDDNEDEDDDEASVQDQEDDDAEDSVEELVEADDSDSEIEAMIKVSRTRSLYCLETFFDRIPVNIPGRFTSCGR